jgi:hypothetical protein
MDVNDYCNSPLNNRNPIIIALLFFCIGFPLKSLCQFFCNCCCVLFVLDFISFVIKSC